MCCLGESHSKETRFSALKYKPNRAMIKLHYTFILPTSVVNAAFEVKSHAYYVVLLVFGCFLVALLVVFFAFSFRTGHCGSALFSMFSS